MIHAAFALVFFMAIYYGTESQAAQEGDGQMIQAPTSQSTMLDDIVVKSSKMDHKQEHMTDSVTVISEKQIELEGYTDTTEILRLTPSVEFKQAGGPGQFSYPKMRGYPQGHYLVLVNGMKLNEAYNAGVGNFITDFRVTFNRHTNIRIIRRLT